MPRAGAVRAEFLPAAIEVEVTPPAPLGRTILWVVIALCGVALVWARASSVDIIAVAPGRLVPSGQVKLLQSAGGGIVKAIRVVDGERVRRGQVLIELDSTLAEADRGRIAAELEAARQELAVQQDFVAAMKPRARGLRAARLDDPIPAASPLRSGGRSVLAATTAAHLGRLRQLELASARRDAELQATLKQVDKLRRTLPLVTERAAAVAKLAAQGLIARQSALEAEQQRIGAEQDLATQEATARATAAAIGELAEERRTLEAEASRAALERIAALETRIAMLTQEFVKAERLATDTILRAPVDGELQELAVHTLGGVVKPGETLAVIVPRGPGLEVEAMVLNRDIGFVAEGQAATIKLEAFPFTRHGTLEGTVVTVGDDAMQHEQLGPVYPVRIRIGRNAIRAAGRAVQLSAGMAANVEVRTGTRRVIDYLLSPVARAADESLRER